MIIIIKIREKGKGSPRNFVGNLKDFRVGLEAVGGGILGIISNS
jgi:hypothetical protein